jgi:chromosome segregation ATPase
MRVPVERDGKTIVLNSYSLLQDRYFEHMRAAGFDGFERGERGSTKEHLDVLDYKIQQENKRLDSLELQAEKKEAKLSKLDEKIAVKATKAATLAEIDGMGHSLPIVPGVHLTDDEAKRLKSLARQVVKSDERIAKVKRDMDALQAEIKTVKRERDEAKIEAKHWYRELQDLKNTVKDYLRLAAKFPARVKEFFAGLFREEQAQEQQREQERQQLMRVRKCRNTAVFPPLAKFRRQ